MNNRNDFLNDLKPIPKPAQTFTAKAGTLLKALKKQEAKIALGLMAILTPFIISGCSGHVNTPTTQTTPSTSIDSTTKSLSDKDSILQDFKQRYISEYNKSNGTNFHPSDIELHMPVQSVLLKTFDEQYVTAGSYPDGTKKVLNNYGSYTIIYPWIGDTIDLIQFTKDGKDFETVTSFYDKENQKSVLTPVLSGNNLNSLLDQLKNKDGLKKGNVLLEYYDIAKIVMDLYNASDKNSVEIYKNKYNAAINTLTNNQTNDFEIE